MAGFKLSAFKGRYPGVERRMLPQSAGTIATDLKLGFGDIRPLHGYETDNFGLIDRGEPASLFKYLGKWLHFGVPASFVTAPSGQDAWDRIVFSLDEYDEENPPAVYVAGSIPPDTNVNEATDGTGPYPATWTALGVPPPNAPTITDYASVEEVDVEDQRTVYYCVTLVNDRGEESAPSLPTDLPVTVNENEIHVELSCALPSQPVNSNDVDATPYRSAVTMRLYRLYAEDSTQAWMYVMEAPATNPTLFVDTYSTATLDGDTLVTFGWNPPPLGLKGLKMLPNGAVVGFKDNELIFSEPWYPYAYPSRYRYKVDYPIVGLGVFGSSVAVLTTAQPYVAVGLHPGEMSLTKLEADQSCVSMRSIVDLGDRVVWASPDGLFSIGSNGVEALTSSYMDKRTWQAEFYPTTIHAYAYEGYYIAFYNGAAGFIANPFNPDDGIIDLSAYAYAGFRDMETDTLYLAMDEGGGYGVFAFDSDANNPLEWEWRSRVVEFPSHVSLGRGQVIGTGYAADPFELSTYYLDDYGVLTLRDDALSITSRNPVTLRAGTLMTDWMVGVRGTQECEAILVGETIKDIKGQ